MKIIDLLNKIANGEEVPKRIKYCDNVYRKCDIGNDYFSDAFYQCFFKDICDLSILNDEVEMLDNEEDKDIPLIPDDELYMFKGDSKELNYNFRVLQGKINEVVEELNKRQ